MKKRALIFSADPGGAECLMPVAKTLSGRFSVIPMCKGTATALFSEHFSDIYEVSGMAFKDIEAGLEDRAIDVVITSASSLPEKDMTEKLLWRWAGKRGLPSIAVLDQWENYVRRFSGTDQSERMAYLPDKIAVMDGLARAEMIREGFPAERLEVTGQPALENFAELVSRIKGGIPADRPGKPDSKLLFTFFSQPIRSFYGKDLGYDERSVFNDIAGIIPILEDKLNKSIDLICKLHPKNDVKDLAAETAYQKNIRFVRDEHSNAELIASSDIVIGMNSVMLIHSILAGVPTIAYEPDRKDALRSCMPVKAGAISCVTGKDGLLSLIVKLKTDNKFFRRYVKNQESCGTHHGATGRIAAIVEKLVYQNSKSCKGKVTVQ